MYYGNVTFVMCLPRSRSAWIAAVFARGALTLHDPLKTCASIDELGERIDSLLAHNNGLPVIVADTGAVLFYPQIAKRFPAARLLFVSRVLADIAESLGSAGQPVDQPALAAAQDALSKARFEAEHMDKRFAHSVLFEHLSDPNVLQVLWQFFGCTGEFDASYFKTACARNIQVPFAEQQANTDIGKVERLMKTRRKGWRHG